MRAPQRSRYQKRRSFRIRPVPVLLAGAVVIVAGIWIGPRLFDWNAHRAAIEAAASGFLGRRVEISGPIRLGLLPQPSITAERVEVRDDGDGVRMGTRALTLNLSLGALLTGRVEVTHVVLDRPDIRLPWPLPRGPISIEPPPWLAALSANVTRGSLVIGPLHVTDANIGVVTGGATTALRIDGTAEAGGEAWQLSIGLAWPQNDGGAPLQLTLQNAATPAGTFGFKGVMAASGQVIGSFTAHGDDLAALVPAPALPFDAEGSLRADGRSVNLTDLALSLGNMPASGNVRLRLTTPKAPMAPSPGLTIHLHTPMLDLAPWLTAFPAGSTSAPPLSLDLDADSAVFGDGLLRRFGLKLVTSATRIRVDDVHATLPGEAAIALTGFYDPASISFIGRMSLGAPSPAVTLHWLAQSKLLPDFSGALSGLASLAITADVAADPRRAAVTGIAGRMNDTTIAGGFALGLGPAASVAAGLDFGKIDLGQWLPPDWLVDPPRPDLLAHALAGTTADLRLTADEVWLGDDRIDHGVLDAAISGGRLNLRQLAGQDQGVQVLVSGAMDGGGVLSDARLVLAAPHANPFIDLLPARLRGERTFWNAPLAATVTAAGPPNALAVSLQGSLGDLDVSAQPVMDLVHDHWQGPVTLQHPNASRLLRTLGYTDAPAWLGEGSLSVVSNVASDGSSWSLSPVTFSLGMLHGSGRLARASARPPAARQITGTLVIDTLPWPEPATDDPIPVALLRGWEATLDITVNRVMNDLLPVASDVHAETRLHDGVLQVAIERARLLGGTLTGTLSLAAADPPTLTATLGLAGAASPPAGDDVLSGLLPVALTATSLNGRATLAARGYSLASWLASLDATMSLTAGPGVIGGIDLGAVSKPGLEATLAELHKADLFAGTSAFNTLKASASVVLGEMQVTGFQLDGAAGVMMATGQVDLVRGVCNLNLALKPAGGGSIVNAVLQGPVSHPASWIVHGTAMN
ncbi:AsmA-like C-terminal region-containing protein [Acidisoma sp.]|uniref:AsmA-like C-terminal region-containing protein n=1 Tax=Acidisoma sp. TaxID=1872115 RepID=UPI003B00EEE4